MCDCIHKVNKKGYSVFGLQFYGECWSGPRAGCSYEKFGKTKGCVNEYKDTCSDDSGLLCSGDSPTHTYVYVPADRPDVPFCPTTTPSKQQTNTPKVTPKTTLKVITHPKITRPVIIGKPHVTCGNVRYKLMKLGCWREWGDARPPRAMPELILTARDKGSKVYSGYDFNRHNYAPFLER